MNTVKLLLVFLLVVPFFVFAQNQTALPNAGLTPESNFYFLDTLGEALREFFTFNPEGKARLQVTFAAERVAEIKVILETKGVEAKGLEIAQSRLQAHLASAVMIMNDQKSEGENVTGLAKELDDKLDPAKKALAQSFKERERALEAKEDALKAELKTAHRAGDTVKAESISTELGKVQAELKLLELEEEDFEDALEEEEEKLEEEMEAKEEAEKAIKEAENEKKEVLSEADEEGVTVPSGTFSTFDSLLAQAKSAFAAGNYTEAKRLAKQAEKNLDAVEEAIENLAEAREKEEELKEEQQEKEREAREENDERKKEDAEKEAERLEKERERAEEDTRKAKERLRDVDEN